MKGPIYYLTKCTRAFIFDKETLSFRFNLIRKPIRLIRKPVHLMKRPIPFIKKPSYLIKEHIRFIKRNQLSS